MKKYILTKNKKEAFGVTLFQIQASVSFGIIKKGELGGWIEREDNLSQDGNAWVSGNAWVYDNARVSGNARVYGNAWVYDNAWVYGDAQVYDNAWVYGDAQVYGNAWVYGKLKISLGHYFGMKFKGEKIKELKTEDGNKILWKK